MPGSYFVSMNNTCYVDPNNPPPDVNGAGNQGNQQGGGNQGNQQNQQNQQQQQQQKDKDIAKAANKNAVDAEPKVRERWGQPGLQDLCKDSTNFTSVFRKDS
jgi:hypothetical protein